MPSSFFRIWLLPHLFDFGMPQRRRKTTSTIPPLQSADCSGTIYDKVPEMADRTVSKNSHALKVPLYFEFYDVYSAQFQLSDLSEPLKKI
jgi:hypothetical protein